MNSSMLTPRQLEILQLLVEGHSDKQIRTELGLKHTASVSQHILRARDRLGVKSREALVAYSVAFGWVIVPTLPASIAHPP